MTAPDLRVGEIEDRLAAITPGDWTYHSGISVVEVLPKFDLHRFDQMSTDIFKVLESDADGIFAANAPADVAYLLAELRDREGKLARVEAQVSATEELAEIVIGEDLQAGLRMVARGIRAAVAASGGGGE